MNFRKLTRSQIVFYVLSLLVVLSMIISAFASMLTPSVNATSTSTRTPVATVQR